MAVGVGVDVGSVGVDVVWMAVGAGVCVDCFVGLTVGVVLGWQ